MNDYLVNGPALETASICPTLLWAHGAGAAMDSEFMNNFAELVSDADIRIVRFEFPYMAARRTEGKKAPPPKAEKLVPEFQTRVKDIAATVKGPLFIGGKSMGGRIATMIADAKETHPLIRGVICLGYPFHPTGKPEKLRTSHLEGLKTPTLICQGERDSLGSRAEVDALTLSKVIRIDWSIDGDHDLKPRKKSGVTHQQNLLLAAAASIGFMFGKSG